MTVGFQKYNLIGFLMTLTVFFPDIYIFGWAILNGFFNIFFFFLLFAIAKWNQVV